METRELGTSVVGSQYEDALTFRQEGQCVTLKTT
jgi:hypothetical protein